MKRLGTLKGADGASRRLVTEVRGMSIFINRSKRAGYPYL